MLCHKHYHSLEEKMCVSQHLSGTFLILIVIQQGINLHKYKVSVILVRF